MIAVATDEDLLYIIISQRQYKSKKFIIRDHFNR